MSFRFWRRIRIAPGVTLNLSKSTASLSFGPRGAKYTVSPRGNRVTAGLPGTGLFYTVHEPRRPSAANAPRVAQRDRLDLGFFQRLFTPADERGLVDGLKTLNAGDEGAALAEFEKAASLPDAAWMAGMLRLRREDFAPARRQLEAALARLDRLGNLLEKYGITAQVTFPVTPEVDAHARPCARGTLLALVEIAQLTGDRAEAMRHVELLLTIEPDDPVVLLSFAELILESDADRAQLERVVALTAGIANETPVDTALLLYRGRALARLGLHDAAIDVLTLALLRRKDRAEMISRYMVLIQNERKLVMMRPYQVYAVKAIVDCIHENRGNGYIWHTTGSGKTLTSFKASTLLKDNPDIEKCLFVVDRKDLDKQTREEFNRFQPGCVEENTNTETLVQRLLSDDYRNKVIVTTIQKLGLALDGTNRKQYRERLEPLRNKRVVFIFDECHRSQFGENHQAIREFFPNAQLFGFTGTPIFEQNAGYSRIEGREASLVTTKDIFDKDLHTYTITHAIDDGNVLRFHVDYFRPDGAAVKPGETPAKRAVVEAILEKHDAATNQRKFNALFATASIDEAIEYYRLFREIQAARAAQDPEFMPLNIACVFSPPAEGNRDVAQLQEDLPQELEDNRKDPGRKKAALAEIIADYNARYGTNHDLANFDSYYQDIQSRIKDQKYPNADLPRGRKIDIIIVVDMLLTGFDSAYLNTLYVDKNLKYHSLIQAFSRTNRVLNDSKPYGNILDFRAQRAAVDEAIALFSGEAPERAKEVWLVDPAPQVIERLAEATRSLTEFMAGHGLPARPEEVSNLKGDAARAGFIERFKEVRRFATQLEQYTDLAPEQKVQIQALIPRDDLRAFSARYLDLARQLQDKARKSDDLAAPGAQLDFEFVLFDSALIDYDYIMGLIARFSQAEPKRQTMTRADLMRLLASSARLMEERADLEAYVATLAEGEGLSEAEIRKGYERFKAQRQAEELARIAERHGLDVEALQGFVDLILGRMIFDPDALTELFRQRGLGWKARAQAELALMEDLIPWLNRKAEGREISGLEVYDVR